MGRCNPTLVSLSPNNKCSKEHELNIYIITYASRFSNNQGPTYFAAVKLILRYVKRTSNRSLKFYIKQPTDIIGYCDVDWTSDEERRPTIGYVFLKNGSAISWCSKRQPTIPLHTTDAKYMSVATVTEETLWLRGHSRELEGDA